MPIDSPGIARALLGSSRRRRGSTAKAAVAGRLWPYVVVLAVALIWATSALADAAVPESAPQGAAPAADSFQSLDSEVQSLTQDVVDLNRDLFMLEEELLFPANTQVAVFVSMDVGTFFALDSVKIVLDGKEVTNYLYTQREAEALLRGGVHRVWLGNLRAGPHELTAFFTGKGPHDRDYKRGATLQLEKGVGAKYVELKISDRERQLQPEFVVKEWE
jgi:hypothetical protein